MKLSGKEKVILVFFPAIIIIVAGLFLFILPEYNKTELNHNNLESVKTRRDQIHDSLAREGEIDQEIQTALDRASRLSLNFYDDLTPYEADAIIRDILEATNMTTDSLSIGSFTTATLSVEDYAETVVSYPLKEYAGYASSAGEDAVYDLQYDEAGNLIIPEEFADPDPDKALRDYLIAALSTRHQTIGAITVNFNIEGTRGDFLNFLDYVANLERATLINSTTITYAASVPQSSGNNNTDSITESAEPAESAEGQDVVHPANGTVENNNNNKEPIAAKPGDNDKISAPVSMTLFCAVPPSTGEFASAVPSEASPQE